ncbi:hypothetical protein RTP6_002473 [Batrachochytrium dendrobatidis]
MEISFITPTSECMRINIQTTDTSNDSCKCIDRVLNNSSVYKSASLEIVTVIQTVSCPDITVANNQTHTCLFFGNLIIHSSKCLKPTKNTTSFDIQCFIGEYNKDKEFLQRIGRYLLVIFW